MHTRFSQSWVRIEKKYFYEFLYFLFYLSVQYNVTDLNNPLIIYIYLYIRCVFLQCCRNIIKKIFFLEENFKIDFSFSIVAEGWKFTMQKKSLPHTIKNLYLRYVYFFTIKKRGENMLSFRFPCGVAGSIFLFLETNTWV